MAVKKEILIYGPMGPWTAEYVIREINTYDDDADLTLRINTTGGYVGQGKAMLSKLSDRKGAVQMFVDNEASSMGAFMLLYGKGNVANEEAKIRFHKAAFPTYYEPSQEEETELKEMNDGFRAKMVSRLNGSAKAAMLIAKIFEPDVRNTVTLSAAEAKEVGLIEEVRPMDLGTREKIAAYMGADYAGCQDFEFKDLRSGAPAAGATSTNKNKNERAMTIEQLQAEHPALYAQVIAKGQEAGATAERDRVGSFMAFYEADPKAVKAGIESGKAMTETQRSEFAIAAFKSAQNSAHAEDNVPPVDPVTPKPQAGTALSEIEAELNKRGVILKH